MTAEAITVIITVSGIVLAGLTALIGGFMYCWAEDKRKHLRDLKAMKLGYEQVLLSGKIDPIRKLTKKEETV